MIEKITQSFMCDMREYKAGGSCGNIIREKYINGRILEDSSPSMKLGQWFEFCLSGAIPKGGNIPQPEYMASALKRNKGSVVGLTAHDMYEPYRQALSDAAFIKGYMEAMGLELVEVGKTYHRGRFKGTIDLVVRTTMDMSFVDENGREIAWKAGDMFIIDLKYSGLLYDRWEKFGWAWSKIQKEFHGTQAKQYHYIRKLPFMFWVTQPAGKEKDENGKPNPPDCKIFFVPIDEMMVEEHIAEGNKLLEDLEFQSKIGVFVPRPGLKKCRSCVLFSECEDKHTFPHPELVDITLFDE